jgi:hypothetical protein
MAVKKRAAIKKASTKKAATKQSKAKSSKGVRYSEDQKKAVIDFVNQVNAERGRGGVTAAVKKFGVTALTISNWIKKIGAPAVTSAAPAKAESSSEAVLKSLLSLQEEITGLQQQLAAKRKVFDQLKKKL